MSVLDDLAVEAGDGDVIAGVPARLVAAPATTEEAAALIAASRDLTVVVRGGGTKVQQGPPPRRLDLIIDTRRLAGVVEHAAGDLITVVKAGTPMAELHDLPGQQLALDAPPAATAGGTVAANASGPRRLRYGTARDLLIGITVVRPDGRITKSGGKVVKNVAGYDLGKLYTGSQGTLGLITECVFRLHPVPLFAAFVRSNAPPTHAANILAGQFAASALEVSAAPGAAPELAVLLEGTEAGVRARAATVARLLDGEVTGAPPPWWDTPPWPADSPSLALKLTCTLAAVPALVRAAVEAGLTIRGSAGTGVLYAGVPSPAATPGQPGQVADVVNLLRAAATAAGGHAVVLIAPPAARDGIDMWGPVPGLDLMRRVKDRFDPDHRFAPGRFVGGI
ncbi:FAD-linked oxidase [Actinoplanes philippinensis]|uniref:Glycolate oxidase FAD binding subunit n=1 Tax=Actinoplanes philippinensis TaxID=35752 RepID=A0A1I2GWB0_9ACTN|nr:FAD-binding oxidoreductase [Actinoplanes philippinensis]GIE78187.1 FAD-linked oxidase [Actinoplanes philippinensis]SFF21995.1 glycolate oxidase FAD binding subunit [Actinoplanes philippinensis]